MNSIVFLKLIYIGNIYFYAKENVFFTCPPNMNLHLQFQLNQHKIDLVVEGN